MKTIFLIALVSCIGALAYARVDVALGINAGVPYYAEPPSYYDPYAEPVWMDAPVQVIMIDGVPHRMHMWNGRWYDESWRGERRRGDWRDMRDDHDHDWHRGH